MENKKLFRIEVKVVQEFSSAVLVRAENAAKARKLLEEEFYQSDYLYEKTTDCPDDSSISFSRPRPVSPENEQGEISSCLLSDSFHEQ